MEYDMSHAMIFQNWKLTFIKDLNIKKNKKFTITPLILVWPTFSSQMLPGLKYTICEKGLIFKDMVFLFHFL